MTRQSTFLAALVLTLSSLASAQMGRGGGGDPFGLANLKTQIKASDEEWKVIGPKLREVAMARQAVNASVDDTNAGEFGRGGRGPGGPGGGNDTFNGPSSDSGGGRGGRRGPGGFGRDGGPPSTQPGEFPPEGDFGRRGRRGGFGPPDFGGQGPEGFGPGGRGGPEGRGGRGGPMGGRGGNAVLSALIDLQNTVKDPQSTPEQIAEKTTAVNAARSKAKTQLTAAQTELKLLLTDDQQAMLVEQGYLD